ncbi:MAG: DUF1285 domain-containing protein [Pseudomonadota bacterium]
MTNSPNHVKPTAESIAQSAQAATQGKLPPVERWNPPFCGDLDMRIARDGTWFYLGTPIGRKPLVKLFSSIIKKEGDKYFLVTPVEKVGITVDDAPFVAIDYQLIDLEGIPTLRFETHVGDFALAGPEHPIRIEIDASGEPSPYVLIRRNLEALIDRKSFYRLVDICETQTVNGEEWFGVSSGGEFFQIILQSDLEAAL